MFIGLLSMNKLHNWNLLNCCFTAASSKNKSFCAQAVTLQKRLACRVEFTALKNPPRLIAGVDCAFSKDGWEIFAAVVVVRFPGLCLVEMATAVRGVSVPYIPGLLSFREAPVCIAAVEKLKNKPDMFIIDGQGIAHPRRLGLASHLGLFFDKLTIGCAKSRLVGTYTEPGLKKGSYSFLRDKKASHERRATSDEIIGAVVRTRTGVKPVFVSVGHKCRLDDAIEWTLKCSVKYRLPEPTRIAHNIVSKIRSK